MGIQNSRSKSYEKLQMLIPLTTMSNSNLIENSPIERKILPLNCLDNIDKQQHTSIDLSNFDEENPIGTKNMIEPKQSLSIELFQISSDQELSYEDTMSIIWLDIHVNETLENIMLQEKLKKITKSLIVFNASEQFEEYVRQIPINERVILIIDDCLGITIISLVRNLTQIKTIYVYSHMCKYDRNKFKQFDKVNKIVMRLKCQTIILFHFR